MSTVQWPCGAQTNYPGRLDGSAGQGAALQSFWRDHWALCLGGCAAFRVDFLPVEVAYGPPPPPPTRPYVGNPFWVMPAVRDGNVGGCYGCYVDPLVCGSCATHCRCHESK